MSELRIPTLLSNKKSSPECKKLKCVLGKRIAGQSPITVYRCTLANYKEKLVAKAVVVGQDDVKDSLQEADLLSRLSHPYLVKYVHSYLDTKKLYIITEYCEGGDLRKVIDYQRGRRENLFGTDIVLGWFTQLCFALQYIHKQKILHRDVTPSNVFLAADGTVKLGDFGLAKILEYQSQLRSSGADNSILYQAPEVSVGGQPVSPKCDMFAVGCILYELCTGTQPFESSSLSKSLKNACRSVYKRLPPSCGDELQSLVDRLLSCHAHQRPSAEEILRQPFLKRFVTHFSPGDAGRSMPMRDEVTSSGQTVMEVLKSIRQAMSGVKDILSESGTRTPPNTPITQDKGSRATVPQMPDSLLLAAKAAAKLNSACSQWYDTRRRSSRVSMEERSSVLSDRSDKLSPVSRANSTNNSFLDSTEKTSFQKLQTELTTLGSNFLKILKSRQDAD